jgi:hypothetical protein
MIPKTICKNCTHSVCKGPRESIHSWFCKLEKLEPTQCRITGEHCYTGPNDYNSDNKYGHCSFKNHGNCPDYKKKKLFGKE